MLAFGLLTAGKIRWIRVRCLKNHSATAAAQGPYLSQRSKTAGCVHYDS